MTEAGQATRQGAPRDGVWTCVYPHPPEQTARQRRRVVTLESAAARSAPTSDLAPGMHVVYWPGLRVGDGRSGKALSGWALLQGHTWGAYIRKLDGGSDFIAATHIAIVGAPVPLAGQPTSGVMSREPVGRHDARDGHTSTGASDVPRGRSGPDTPPAIPSPDAGGGKPQLGDNGCGAEATRQIGRREAVGVVAAQAGSAPGNGGPGTAPVFEMVAYGQPAPQGSKRHVGKGVMVESSKALKPWREAVKTEALWNGHPHPSRLDGPLLVSMVFTLRKPASAPKRRRTWPDRTPDLSKLARATEDALTDAGVWADDARIVEYVRLAKVFPSEDSDALHIPGVRVRIWQVSPDA